MAAQLVFKTTAKHHIPQESGHHMTSTMGCLYTELIVVFWFGFRAPYLVAWGPSGQFGSSGHAVTAFDDVAGSSSATRAL